MEDLVNIFIKGVFIDNMIFAYFLGMCSYLAVSKTVDTAVGLGAAVIFVLGVTVPINYLLENYLLKEGSLSCEHPIEHVGAQFSLQQSGAKFGAPSAPGNVSRAPSRSAL